MANNAELSPEQRIEELNKIFADPRMRKPRSISSSGLGLVTSPTIKKLSPEQRIEELNKIFADPRMRKQP